MSTLPIRCSVASLVLISAAIGCSRERPTDLPAGASADRRERASEPDVTVDDPTRPDPGTKGLSEEDFRFAAYEGKLGTVRQGIEAGIDINAPDPVQSLTALHMAAYNGHTEVVGLLLEQDDVVVDCLDHEGKTPLLHACTGPYAETVELLIESGADVNAKEKTEGFTPLMMGAGLGQLEVVQLLLKHGADKDQVDADGDSALTHARNSGHTAIAALLQ